MPWISVNFWLLQNYGYEGVEKQSLFSCMANIRTWRGTWAPQFTRVPTILWCLPDTQAEGRLSSIVLNKSALLIASLAPVVHLTFHSCPETELWAEIISVLVFVISQADSSTIGKYRERERGKDGIRRRETERLREKLRKLAYQRFSLVTKQKIGIDFFSLHLQTQKIEQGHFLEKMTPIQI